MTDHHDEDDYEVGYGKPPKKHQWKKGQSGNPAGRPPDDRHLKRVLRDIMTEDIEITENGQKFTVSKQDALLRLIYSKAMNGDRLCAKLLIDLSGKGAHRFSNHD